MKNSKKIKELENRIKTLEFQSRGMLEFALNNNKILENMLEQIISIRKLKTDN